MNVSQKHWTPPLATPPPTPLHILKASCAPGCPLLAAPSSTAHSTIRTIRWEIPCVRLSALDWWMWETRECFLSFYGDLSPCQLCPGGFSAFFSRCGRYCYFSGDWMCACVCVFVCVCVRACFVCTSVFEWVILVFFCRGSLHLKINVSQTLSYCPSLFSLPILFRGSFVFFRQSQQNAL